VKCSSLSASPEAGESHGDHLLDFSDILQALEAQVSATRRGLRLPQSCRGQQHSTTHGKDRSRCTRRTRTRPCSIATGNVIYRLDGGTETHGCPTFFGEDQLVFQYPVASSEHCFSRAFGGAVCYSHCAEGESPKPDCSWSVAKVWCRSRRSQPFVSRRPGERGCQKSLIFSF